MLIQVFISYFLCLMPVNIPFCLLAYIIHFFGYPQKTSHKKTYILPCEGYRYIVLFCKLLLSIFTGL